MQHSPGSERVGTRATTSPTPVQPHAVIPNPDQAKTMLAARRTQNAAGVGFLRDQIERGEDAQAARVLRELIGEYVEVIVRAVRSRAADGAWRPIFDIAGWQPDQSILLCPSHGAMPTAFPRSADG